MRTCISVVYSADDGTVDGAPPTLPGRDTRCEVVVASRLGEWHAGGVRLYRVSFGSAGNKRGNR